MRIDLNVPYQEKDLAKSLGAWWDAGRKTWFVRNMENLEPFMRWMEPRLLQPSKQSKTQSLNYLAVNLAAHEVLQRPAKPKYNNDLRQQRPSLQAYLASENKPQGQVAGASRTVRCLV